MGRGRREIQPPPSLRAGADLLEASGRSEQERPREGESATDVADATSNGLTEISTAATRRQIRGSALLLTGRVLSLGINFAVQVLVVRYLSKEAYGAFVDAISIDTALSLLLILIVLTPVQALDELLAGLFAVMARPRAIFLGNIS